jgi:hypothetical protein
MARRFLDLLDPDHDEFLFAAGDDKQERAKEALKGSKPPWADHRHGSIDAQLAWLNEQQAKGFLSWSLPSAPIRLHLLPGGRGASPHPQARQ